MKSEFHTKLAGVTKRNDCDERIQGLLKDISEYYYEGQVLTVEHESDNPYDENAIKVFFEGNHIGYIKRELAEELAPLVDQERVEAELCEITGGEDGKSYGCNILIRILSEEEAVYSSVKPLVDSYKATSSTSSGHSIKLYDSAYVHSLSNREFTTWAGQYLEWARSLPQDADIQVITTARTQVRIIRDEMSRREQHPVKDSTFDRLIPIGSFREKALPFACAALSFFVTLSVLFSLFA